MATPVQLTYLGGPTAVIVVAGVRFLTDPGFDSAGTEFHSGSYVLQRTQNPALPVEAILPIDAVLLSHDHHFDNLDGSGRAMLGRAKRVLTTEAGAERLRGNAIGIAIWDSIDVSGSNGNSIRVTATPARHGPAHGDRGPVIGFVLESGNPDDGVTYISGDTVWYEGVQQIAARFSITRAILFMGAARVAAVGPDHLTLTAEEGVLVARSMPDAVIVPLHYEGWAHFSEGRAEIEEVFTRAGLRERLIFPVAGHAISLFDASAE